MLIGDRLLQLREEKKLSQGDIEKRTGLLRCYVSRVENGHTVPSLDTLEKFASALGVPLYRLFYEGKRPPERLKLVDEDGSLEISMEGSGEDAKYLRKLRKFLAKMSDSDRQTLLALANKMAKR